MRRLLAVAAITLALGGCATFQRVEGLISGATVSPTAVIVAGNTFDALEATATNYLRLARCNGANGPVCRSPTATKQIIPTIRAGRVARANLETFLRDHPTALGSQGFYDALRAANSTLQAVFAQYKIGS